MPTRIVPFAPDLLPAVARFSQTMWLRPVDDAYLRWRYLECPSQLGFLAINDAGECVAMIWAFRRPYRVGDRRIACLETADWFTVPELRSSMLGLRVMRALMQQPEPIVAVGGSADTLGLLPALRWHHAGTMTQFALPLGGASVGRVLARRFRVPAAWIAAVHRATARHWFAAGRATSPAGGTVVATDRFDPDLVALHDRESRYRLVPALDPDLARWWMAAPPALGPLVVLRFMVGDALAGWSLSRVHPGLSGLDATILEIFAPGDDPALHHWMVDETVARLRTHQPDTIFAAASAAPLQEALRRRRFIVVHDHPVHVWGPALEGSGPIHIGNNTSDTPLFPAPTARPEINRPATKPGPG